VVRLVCWGVPSGGEGITPPSASSSQVRAQILGLPTKESLPTFKKRKKKKLKATLSVAAYFRRMSRQAVKRRARMYFIPP